MAQNRNRRGEGILLTVDDLVGKGSRVGLREEMRGGVESADTITSRSGVLGTAVGETAAARDFVIREKIEAWK